MISKANRSTIAVRSRRSAGVVAAGVMLVVAALAAGCGSGGGPSKSAAKGQETPTTTAAAFARLEPAAFAARMNDKGAVLINVHVPYEGELDRTDAFIPYDHIVGNAHLPKDKHTEVLLYCRSGRMSEIAANALYGVGYTRLAHLEGGMRAWEASGRTLIHNPVHGADSNADNNMKH